MRLGTKARKQYYDLLDKYIADHVDPTVTLPPSKFSDMVSIITPEIPVAHVKTVCTNFIYLLFYLVREKKLSIVLPQTFSGVKAKKEKQK